MSKTFRIPYQQFTTLKERALHPLQSRRYHSLQALDDVSFEVAAGEFFGIVGRNGSGKSTLLKCLAGIYDVDEGDVRVRGRLSPFIELGVGFNPDLTARDNVMVNAIMLGLTRRQARERFDDIIAFAELEDFLDLKLKNYSSGMAVRLAFSVAIEVDADVLLIDEVLAVGDASFQQKCFDQFQRMKEEGRTILYVTHDMGSIERFCDRAMVVEKGRIVAVGDPESAALKYNELNFGGVLHGIDERGEQRYGDHGAAEIVSAWFEDGAGERVAHVAQGQPCRVCFEVRFHRALDDPIFAVTLRNQMRHTIFATGTDWEHGPTGRFEAGRSAVVRVPFENWLAPSRYTASPSIAHPAGADAVDLRTDLASLIISGSRLTGGVADLPHSFEIERS